MCNVLFCSAVLFPLSLPVRGAITKHPSSQPLPPAFQFPSDFCPGLGGGETPWIQRAVVPVRTMVFIVISKAIGGAYYCLIRLLRSKFNTRYFFTR